MGVLRKQLKETRNILKSFQGNARGCLIVEPLWGIPYNLFIPYASVYMMELGCTDTQIGIIASIGLFFQMFFSLISGHITDRVGRKRTTLIFDLIGWSIAVLIWAFAQNFYYFLLAAIINSSFRVVHTSWTCLLVEDTRPEERVHVYTWLQVAGLLAGFFAPLAGLLVKNYGLVPSMRGLYLYAFVSMTSMFIIRNRITAETRMGFLKMQSAKENNFMDTLKEYKRISMQLIKNPDTMLAFTLMVLNNIQITLRSTFQAILLTKGLGLPQQSIGIFPAIISAVMLFIYLFIMPTLGKIHVTQPLLWGCILSIISNSIFVLSPERNLFIIVIGTIIGAVGMAMIYPFIESLVANSIEDEDRAKVMAILYVIILALSAPFGYIGGLLSSVSAKLPFVLIIVTFMVSLLIVIRIKNTENQRKIQQSAETAKL
jgi:DHA1 family tetracycline resistance protein-like MFS transporter